MPTPDQRKHPAQRHVVVRLTEAQFGAIIHGLDLFAEDAEANDRKRDVTVAERAADLIADAWRSAARKADPIPTHTNA